MADKQNPKEPEYGWLYSGQRSQSPDPDPEATQMMRRQESADAEDNAGDRGVDDDGSDDTRVGQQDAEPTQVLAVTPPPGADPTPTRVTPTQASPTGAPSTKADPRQPDPTKLQPQQDRPQSFGGTYAAPPAKSQQPAPAPPRYATPSQNQGGGYVPPRQPADPSSPGGQPPTRKKRRKWWLRGVLALLALWLIFLVAVPIWAWNQISEVDAEPSGDRPGDTSGTTYLLVGSDSREDLTKQERADLGTGDAAGQRTDTIIMLHVPDGDGPNLLLSIPRDSFVDIPGRGESKINAAYAFGGPELLVETVEQATDIHVDNYVEVGFAGFVDIVDAVGGISVCPKQRIDDPKAGNLTLKKGCQDVDGHVALGYARSRAFADGDITRAEHQREVISAVGRQAASWKTVVLPWRYVKVNLSAADTLRVGENVGPIDLARFAWAMAHTSGADAKRCVVPYSDLGAQTSAGAAVIWDEEKAEAVFEAVREDDTATISCTANGR